MEATYKLSIIIVSCANYINIKLHTGMSVHWIAWGWEKQRNGGNGGMVETAEMGENDKGVLNIFCINFLVLSMPIRSHT